MSNFRDQISQVVDQYVELLPTDGLSNEIGADRKASKFLIALAKLAALRDQLLNAKIKKDSLKSIAYAEAINTAPGSNAPVKQANAEAAPDYLAAEEDVAVIDNQLLLIKTYLDIFTNAHLLYRTLMKGDL